MVRICVFKQKTAYEMRISDWSSDVCSSDLPWDGSRAYASYAEGYTVPDVGRIARAIDRAGVDIDKYVNISPIVSNNREIGVEVKRGPVDASAAYFWSTSKNGSLLVAQSVGAPFEEIGRAHV